MGHTDIPDDEIKGTLGNSADKALPDPTLSRPKQMIESEALAQSRCQDHLSRPSIRAVSRSSATRRDSNTPLVLLLLMADSGSNRHSTRTKLSSSELEEWEILLNFLQAENINNAVALIIFRIPSDVKESCSSYKHVIMTS